ncbi:SDR family NAD(P)-dependent oxidoreductase [Wenxinia marina]|uniref:dTDP-D-glucose 4,6-dehydratase n=1 Tax=Wenxinia marina DSM 24838 TaxID=1123501 RepID=A0A0D0Q6M1_9RHOB|nr:SDR family NAD(P)-dependent oxidoreductase [Wenxinia marina]KIQ68097.1 dTDP-D-glucose 4,6-dehydratase [Wenxinia marina DSM 24838]GGL78224.1 NAD-dependent dehydratase [Wenxinia marina]
MSLGVVEWFRPGEHDRVEKVLAGLQATGLRRLRTHVSWADWHADGGGEWYDWLIPRLGEAVELLPCVHYTPPSLSRNGRTTGAPKRLRDYADFIDMLLTRHGQHFEAVELWNEPNNLLDWDWRADAEWLWFSEMIGDAAHWVRERGWKPVLGGPSPFDPAWLDLMGQRGLLQMMHAVGFHGFPGTWDSEAAHWTGWADHVGEMRRELDRYNPAAEIWITEAGYSTWCGDELEQARRLVDAIDAPADRLYWYGYSDLAADIAVQEGLWFDPRHYHLGIARADGRPKLAARLLAEGGEARLRAIAGLGAPAVRRARRPVLITGGAGFIGANLAESFLNDGREVVLLDNLSRAGVEENLEDLTSRFGAKAQTLPLDLRDGRSVRSAVAEARPEAVIHLAAQTAVTTSLDAPVDDFDVNARGTLNLLEALRALGDRTPLVFASTNKVYGDLADVEVSGTGDASLPLDAALRDRGVDEDRPLQFRTPYGCSKGVADQYVLDYAHSYGLPAAVLRMSCIYGPRQFGTEDQGWVAHFLIRALEGRPVTIFGDGRQVRDVLEVGDAVAAYRAVLDGIERFSGRAFNLGGGPANAISLNRLVAEIERLTGRPMALAHEATRAGDQPWFVADTTALADVTGWMPRTGWREGVGRLHGWLRAHRVTGAQPARLSA